MANLKDLPRDEIKQKQGFCKLLYLRENFYYRKLFRTHIAALYREQGDDQFWDEANQRFGVQKLSFQDIPHKNVLDILNPFDSCLFRSTEEIVEAVSKVAPYIFYVPGIEQVVLPGSAKKYFPEFPIRAYMHKTYRRLSDHEKMQNLNIKLSDHERLLIIDLSKDKAHLMREIEAYLDRAATITDKHALRLQTVISDLQIWWRFRIKPDKSYKEIARDLNLKEATVRKKIGRIYEKIHNEPYDRDKFKRLSREDLRWMDQYKDTVCTNCDKRDTCPLPCERLEERLRHDGVDEESVRKGIPHRLSDNNDLFNDQRLRYQNKRKPSSD